MRASGNATLGSIWPCQRSGIAWCSIHCIPLNPADGGLVGTAVWSSQSLRHEYAGTSHTPFPTSVRVDARTLAELVTLQAGAPPSERLRALVRSFTPISLPERYPRLSLLPEQGTIET